MAGSPNRHLPRETEPNIVSGQSINVANYCIGNLCPQSAQNLFFNSKGFSHPAAFAAGNAGVGIARAGYRLSVRMDAYNLFPETRAFLSPNTAVNIASPQTFGRFTPNGNLVGVLWLEF